jgi:CBS domain-containing protein
MASRIPDTSRDAGDTSSTSGRRGRTDEVVGRQTFGSHVSGDTSGMERGSERSGGRGVAGAVRDFYREARDRFSRRGEGAREGGGRDVGRGGEELTDDFRARGDTTGSDYYEPRRLEGSSGSRGLEGRGDRGDRERGGAGVYGVYGGPGDVRQEERGMSGGRYAGSYGTGYSAYGDDHRAGALDERTARRGYEVDEGFRRDGEYRAGEGSRTDVGYRGGDDRTGEYRGGEAYRGGEGERGGGYRGDEYRGGEYVPEMRSGDPMTARLLARRPWGESKDWKDTDLDQHGSRGRRSVATDRDRDGDGARSGRTGVDMGEMARRYHHSDRDRRDAEFNGGVGSRHTGPSLRADDPSFDYYADPPAGPALRPTHGRADEARRDPEDRARMAASGNWSGERRDFGRPDFGGGTSSLGAGAFRQPAQPTHAQPTHAQPAHAQPTHAQPGYGPGAQAQRAGRWQREPLTAREVMTKRLTTLRADFTLQEAAQLMRDSNVGMLPVVDAERRLLGVLTDRDIVVRALHEDRRPSTTKVQDVMSSDDLECVTPDDSVHHVIELMGRKQVRRVPVVDQGNKLVGIIALADLATRAHEDEELQEALESISQRKSFWSKLVT